MAKKPDKPLPRKARSRTPTEAERALFRAAMAGAEPLARRRRSVAEKIEEAPLPAPDPDPDPRSVAPLPPATPRPPLTPPTPDLEAGRAAGLDRRTMERLRKGRMRPEARLDLHGMTANAAHAALERFLAESQRSGRRCVLVITGKGALGSGGGVIRRELAAWLNSEANRPRILGFAQARPADGGGGAFYVLIRRRR